MKTLIISGSSRKDGETKMVVEELMRLSHWDCIDLNDYRFDYYDYEHRNRDDDFIPLMREIIAKYDVFVMVTPVYWYAMSGIMKVFFDRITDLLEIEMDLGRKLRKKGMAALSVSIGNHLGDYFWLPFSETAAYLGMNYLGNIHTIAGSIDPDGLKEFIQSVNRQSDRLTN